MQDVPSRRRFLARSAIATIPVALAGCLTDDGDGESGGASTTSGDDTNGDDGGDATKTDGDDGDAGDAGETTDDGTSDEDATSTGTATEPRDVSFQTESGTTIDATAYGPGDANCGVVLVPQINLDRESWQPQAAFVADQGYLALAIDEDPDARAASVRAAVQYLRGDAGASTIALVGASTGGEAVVTANATVDASVAGTMALSAAGGADHASDLQGRSVFVVSEGDEDRFVRVANDLHENAPEPKELVTYDGAAHGQGLFDSPHASDLRDRLSGFLDAVCGT